MRIIENRYYIQAKREENRITISIPKTTGICTTILIFYESSGQQMFAAQWGISHSFPPCTFFPVKVITLPTASWLCAPNKISLTHHLQKLSSSLVI